MDHVMPEFGPSPDVTQLIHRMQTGDVDAREQLIALLYEHLHGRAAPELARRGGSSLFEPTALVNEVWMRLQESDGTFGNRQHFLATASATMRNLLIDHARRRRRGPDLDGDDDGSPMLDALVSRYEEGGLDLLALHEALEDLTVLDPEAARLVEMRFFVGASAEDAAAAAGLSPRTATRRFDFAKRWLKKRLGD
ncbi:MAG: ECF-type sigma factor [Planctomycetota bacterium]